MKQSLQFLAVSFFLVILVCTSSVLVAQETGEIRGTAKDATRSEALIGANIILEGTTIGTVTDLEGNFVIRKVPAGKFNVIARFVGYKNLSKEVTVAAGRPATVDFVLTATTVQLDEVVVTGQGFATEKRRLASTVESVSAKDLENIPVKTLDAVLQGRIPGMTALQQGGAPGQGARILTRGVKGAFSQTTPVIYVDGIRVDNSMSYLSSNGTGGTRSTALADIMTGEIDRIEVIKGGAAATLYGSEAANGVIQIFTKKGTPGAIRWSASIVGGMDMPHLENIVSQYTKDKFFQDGAFQSYRLAATGGSDVISYNVAGQIRENKGVALENRLNDQLYNLSGGVRVVVSEVASLEFSANYSRNRFGKMYNDNSSQGILSNMEIEGRFDISSNKDSLLAQHMLNEFYETSNRFITSTNLTYQPFSWWENKFIVGVDYRKSEDRVFVPMEGGAFFGTVGGYLNRSDREYKTLTLAYNASFTLPEVGPVSQKLIAGYQAFRVDDRNVGGSGTTFKIPGTKDFDNASVITGFEVNQELFSYGFHVLDQIALFDRIYFDVGVRFDGNSAFGKNIGIQTYPKVGVAYNIAEEEWWPEAIRSTISNFKVRGSWGKTGSFPPPFTRDRQYGAANYMNDVGLAFGNPGNKDLLPEKTTSIDAGFDAGFFNDRLSVEFSYFRQITNGGFGNITEDPAAGLGNQRRNVAEILNRGIEVSIRAAAVESEDLSVNLRGTVATLYNELTSLGGAAEFTITGFLFAPMRAHVGSPVGTIRAVKPRLEADGTYRGNSDEVYVGTPTPTLTTSFGGDIVLFKDISITTLFEGAFGHYIINQSLSRKMVNALANPVLYQEVIALIPKVETGSVAYNRNTASYYLVEKGDWLKWRELSIRYRLPRNILNGAYITASVRNIATFATKATKVDPETSFIPSGTLELGGIVGTTVEAPRQFRLGIDITL
ncbi:MAG: TonB-dependent receptor [bacterium]